MVDWTKIAAALNPPIPEEAAVALAPGLEKLESAVDKLCEPLAIDTLPWAGSPWQK
jgi:hypothetical protein